MQKLQQQVKKCQPSLDSLLNEGEELSKSCPSKSTEFQRESKALDTCVKSTKGEVDAVFRRFVVPQNMR